MILNNVSKKYGDKSVIKNFSLTVEDGTVVSLLGVSGVGKTTLLNIIAGLIPFEGSVTGVGRVSYVFQTTRLIPNLTVRQNVEFVLKSVISDKEKRGAAAAAVLNTVELGGYADAYPSSLSGGMAQRVSMARAFAYPSDTLLMDEPFTGLDVSLKKRLIGAFADLYGKGGRTVVCVTHDIDDALLLSDRIVVIGQEGEILFDVKMKSGKFTRTLSDDETVSIKQRIYDLI